MNNAIFWTSIAAIIQALATIVLVSITLGYARDTKRLAEIAESQIDQSNKELEQLREQAKVAREQLELERKPNLIFSVTGSYPDYILTLTNLSRYAILIHNVKNQRDEESDSSRPVSASLTKAVLSPSEQTRVHKVLEYEHKQHSAFEVEREILTRKAKVSVVYTYGPTQDTTHLESWSIELHSGNENKNILITRL